MPKRACLILSVALLVSLMLGACGDSPTAQPVAVNNAIPTANLGGTSPSSVTTAAMTTTAVASANSPIKVRLSFPSGKNSNNGLVATSFAELVKQKTNGQVEFELYSDSSIAGGDQLTAINMVQSNRIEAIVSQASFFSNLDPEIELLGYPFLFPSRENALRFLATDDGKKLIATLEQYNFKNLAISDQGFRQVSNSKRPVTSPADLTGMRIRIPQSTLYTKIFKALGAEPITMNFSPELYKALQTKTLDGQDAPFAFTAVNKFYEVSPYLTVLNYSWDPLLLNFSQTFWKSLPPSIQSSLLEAGEELTRTFNSKEVETENAALEQFRQAGVQIVNLTPAQQQVFANSTKAIYAEAETRFGQDYLAKLLKAARS